MLIDWFTVAAQILNFLILVYLLKRFLYRPIVQHMNQREEQIAERLQQAAQKNAEAQRLIDEFRRRQDAIEEESVEKLQQVEQQAQLRRQELLEEARTQAHHKRRSWLQALEQEKNEFARGLKTRSSQTILALVQRALQDLADEPLNNRLAAVLLNRLQHLDPDLRARLARAAETGEITVRSTFELDPAMQRRITAALRQFCAQEASVVFRVDKEQPLGVEASAGSVRFSWGIAGYLEELETQVLALFDDPGRSQREPLGGQATPEEAAGSPGAGP